MAFENDPIGYAISEFSEKNAAENIIVFSDLCDDDVIPVNYLFVTGSNIRSRLVRQFLFREIQRPIFSHPDSECLQGGRTVMFFIKSLLFRTCL